MIVIAVNLIRFNYEWQKQNRKYSEVVSTFGGIWFEYARCAQHDSINLMNISAFTCCCYCIASVQMWTHTHKKHEHACTFVHIKFSADWIVKNNVDNILGENVLQRNEVKSKSTATAHSGTIRQHNKPSEWEKEKKDRRWQNQQQHLKIKTSKIHVKISVVINPDHASLN